MSTKVNAKNIRPENHSENSVLEILKDDAKAASIDPPRHQKPNYRTKGWHRIRGGQIKEFTKDQPEPRSIFGDMIAEGELALIAAEQGTGKSGFLWNLFRDLKNGRPIFGDRNMVPGIPPEEMEIAISLGEMTEKQFETRHPDVNTSGKEIMLSFWSPDPEGDLDGAEEAQMIDDVADLAIECGFNIIGIDSGSFLVDDFDPKKLRPLLRKLMRIQRKAAKKQGRKVTILLLLHTRKIEDRTKYTDINDIYGDSQQANIADQTIMLRKSSLEADQFFAVHKKYRQVINPTYLGGELGPVYLMQRENDPANGYMVKAVGGLHYEDHHLAIKGQRGGDDFVKCAEIAKTLIEEKGVATYTGIHSKVKKMKDFNIGKATIQRHLSEIRDHLPVEYQGKIQFPAS